MGYSLSGLLCCFFFRRVRILSSVPAQSFSGLVKLLGPLLLVLLSLLISSEQAFLTDGIKGLLDVNQELL
jgi:hypothetical protein